MWHRITPRRLALLLLMLAVALLLPNLYPGSELVRIRNALALGPVLDAQSDWQPSTRPADFKSEVAPPDPFFADLARRLGLAALPDDDARVRAISAHLLGSAARLNGGIIDRHLQETHRLITTEGQGNCGDFVRVYTAIANAAGMTVRPWAFSLDGFGGHGHIWLESWNHERRAWQLVDIFQNYEFVLADGVPLSARQMHAALVVGQPELSLRPLHPSARPGWVIEAKAWDYFRRGADEWYALWGNNAMEQDRNPLMRATGEVSWSLRGVAALVVGLQPQVRPLPTAGNESRIRVLEVVRSRVLGAAGLITGAAVLWLVPVVWRRGDASRRPASRPLGPMD